MAGKSTTAQLSGKSFLKIAEKNIYALDCAIFRAPYVLLDFDNKSVGLVATLDAAYSSIENRDDVSSFVATLQPGYVGMDIDPIDCGADPECGEAASDDIVSWCDKLGLSWLRRTSGRPGHRHIIVKLPPELRGELAMLARTVAKLHGVSIVVRSSLRPLGAPHRSGLLAATFDGNIDHSKPSGRQAPSMPATAGQLVLGVAQRRLAKMRKTTNSRSEGEFGETLARLRAGWNRSDCWKAVNRQGSKASEMGNRNWRRWVLAPAVTLVDAERSVEARTAWANFCRASPEQGSRLGFDEWLEVRWLPAQEEAARDRPRRLKTTSTVGSALATSVPVGRNEAAPEQIEVMARAFVTAAHERARRITRLPGGVKLTTLCIALIALSRPIVTRHGSISVRAWAEAALLDPKTIRRARDAAVEIGLIRQVHAYGGDVTDCDAWLPTDQVAAMVESMGLYDNSPTGRYAPEHEASGGADLARLERTHHHERRRWYVLVNDGFRRCGMRPGKSLLEQQGVEKVAVVMTHKTWWGSLSHEERERRRRTRRAIIRALSVKDRMRWLEWLGRRRVIVSIVDRILQGVDATEDERTLLHRAPAALARGLRGSTTWF